MQFDIDIKTTNCMHGLTIDPFAVLLVSGCFNYIMKNLKKKYSMDYETQVLIDHDIIYMYA